MKRRFLDQFDFARIDISLLHVANQLKLAKTVSVSVSVSVS